MNTFVNKKTFFLYFFHLLMLLSSTVEATIYQKFNNQKELSFSNIESPTATIINLRKINYYHSDSWMNAQKNNIEIKNNNYQNIFISKPVYHETFQNNSDIPVEITITPPLQSEDFIELLLDGVSIKKLKETSTVLSNLDRGEHKLIAKLLNKQQILMTSNIITFYIQMAHEKNEN